MSPSPLDPALERCERALLRIERSLDTRSRGGGRESELRAKVAAVVAELDDMIGQAGGGR